MKKRMKKNNIWMAVILIACFAFTNVFCFSNTVFAKRLSTVRQVEKLAKKKVAGARVLEIEKDRENGVLVYEVQLRKGKKEYDLVYRASNGKLMEYGWEFDSWYVKRGTGKIISMSKCKKLAKKQVSNARINSIAKKREDGVEVYKVKMQKGGKAYEMEFHARTGKLLKYEWELVTWKQEIF